MSDFTQERSGHWYTTEGQPCHTQPDGKKTTLRHARKQNLLPSVTSILSIIPKYTVDDWRVEQAVLATMQCMVQEGASNLTAQEMMAKVASRLEDATSVGRKFGTEMHSVIEYINKNGQLPPALSPLSNLHPEHAAKYWTWLNGSGITVKEVERSIVGSINGFVNGFGFGGCIDMTGIRLVQTPRGNTRNVRVIVDFKTQKVKGGKPRIYPEWAYQLAAYRHALNNDADFGTTQCISVVIDSETGEIWEHTWEVAAIDKGFTVFRNAFELWMSVKGYCPYAAKPTSIQNGYILVEDAPLTNTLRGPMTWSEVDMAIETVTQHPPPPPPQTTVEMRQLMDDFSRETRRAVANMVAIQSTPPEPPF